MNQIGGVSVIPSQYKALACINLVTETDVAVRTVTLHLPHVTVGHGDYPYIIRHLDPGLKDTVTLIVEEVDNKLNFVIKQAPFETEVFLQRFLPLQVVCPHDGFVNGFHVVPSPD